jgi:hypothetical protein
LDTLYVDDFQPSAKHFADISWLGLTARTRQSDWASENTRNVRFWFFVFLQRPLDGEKFFSNPLQLVGNIADCSWGVVLRPRHGLEGYTIHPQKSVR